MRVWAHTLVKNEALWLWYSVSSVIDHVDKVLLWDTGSTDGTLDIISELKRIYPDKILFKRREVNTAEEFTEARQEMLDVTKSEWFLMLDGDEIWWEASIKKVVETINAEGGSLESIVVPTVNLVGDVFHYQGSGSGRYRFGEKVGHYNLRAVDRNIPGLRSQGKHGVWGWADGDGKMIQERSPEGVGFVGVPYLHATFLQRSTGGKGAEVVKREKKLKHEIGVRFSRDFYYPEVFFRPKPEIVISPWNRMAPRFKFRAFFETPLRKIKRKLWWGKIGY